jgi:hypothetical protein
MTKPKKKATTIQLTDVEKEFYTYLGLLSVKFSTMENNLAQIVAKLIHNEEDLVTAILTEDNTLHKNIELIKQINKVRDFQVPYITNMLDLIQKVKSTRNLFIHGTWSKPFESQNDIMSLCNDIRLKYIEKKDKNGRVWKEWQYNDNKEFRLSYIIQQIHGINDIIYIQETMLKKLEDEDFN